MLSERSLIALELRTLVGALLVAGGGLVAAWRGFVQVEHRLTVIETQQRLLMGVLGVKEQR